MSAGAIVIITMGLCVIATVFAVWVWNALVLIGKEEYLAAAVFSSGCAILLVILYSAVNAFASALGAA